MKFCINTPMFHKRLPFASGMLRSWSSRGRSIGFGLIGLGLLSLTVSDASAYTALAMRVTLQDSTPAKSREEIDDMIFTNPLGVAKFYEDASYGQATWTGTTLDVSVPYSTTDGSSSNQWADAADDEARAQGYEPNNYDAKICLFDTGGGGLSAGDGGTDRVFLFYSGDFATLAHELGHGIGLDHSSTDFNNTGAPDSEYGDQSDVMGIDSNYTFNAPHRVQKGWLGATSLTGNGTYTVAPVEQNGGDRVFRYDPADGGQSYYFSYRQPIGFDGANTYWDGAGKSPIGSPYTNGLNIHRFQGPGDQDNTLEVTQPLSDGDSYTIPGTSVVIQQIAHDGNGVTFSVDGF